jgi:hypothetical protein
MFAAPRAAMFHVKQFLYGPVAVQLSGKILDSEHDPNMRMLYYEQAPNRLRAAILVCRRPA